MSKAPVSRSRTRRAALAVAAIGLLAALSGCVVAPARPYYGHYPYYNHYYYYGY